MDDSFVYGWKKDYGMKLTTSNRYILLLRGYDFGNLSSLQFIWDLLEIMVIDL